jgi:hypothetical protein
MLLIAACSKDKGNYDYIEVPKPVVTAIDTAYTATVGDSLIIIPEVLLKTGKNDYSCFWKIDVPEKAMSMDYEGQALRIVFGLGANRYNALLKVRDNNNGQVYFYKFVIKGQTAFTRGVLVLSNDANKTVLTFIKPDGTVQPDIYNNINKEVLPGGAMQLVPVRNQFYTNQLSNYWITYSGGGSGAVQLDANTLQRTKYLAENFYTAPSVMKVTGFLNMMNGVTTGIINGKMYIGTTETAPFWPYYGFWGVPVDGSYNLHPNVLHNLYERPYDGYFLGFEDTKKQFLGFTTNTFLDTIYNATSGAFNPKDLKMDLVYMNRFTDNEIYAFFDSVGKKIELKFGVDFSADKRVFTPAYKRVFPGASFLTADTKWQSSPIGVFFFTSNDKIYRYNPVNNEVKALDANFNGKKVMMIKVLNGGNLLVAGVEGSIYYLDISVGQNGANPQKIDGIPGAPADIYIREN